MVLSSSALRVVAPYAVVAGTWIAVSDRLPGADSLVAQTAKGLGFVVVTSVLAYVLIARHDTRLADAHARLVEMESSYRAVFDSSPSPTYVVDRSSGRITAISDAAVAWYGSDRATLLGSEASSLHPPAERAAFSRWLARDAQEAAGDPWHQYRAGTVAPVTLAGADVEFGGVAARMVTLTDESARVAAERRVHILQQVGDAMPLGLLVLRRDADGSDRWIVDTANRAVRRLLGYENGELIGAPLSDLAISEKLTEERTQRIVAEATDEHLEEVVRANEREHRILGLRAFGFGAGLGVIISDVTELRGMEEARHRLLDRLLRTAELERQRLARDLHDGPVQELAALTLRLGLARLDRGDGESDDLEQLEDALQAAIQSLRLLLFDLHPPELEAGLVEATRSFAAGLHQLGGPPVEVEADVQEDLDRAVADAAFRIVREALTNAVRHAGAGAITVEMASEAQGLRLAIRDDGNGLSEPRASEAAASGHLGLRAMRDCAELLGGRLEVDGSSRGTTVRAELPMAR